MVQNPGNIRWRISYKNTESKLFQSSISKELFSFCGFWRHTIEWITNILQGRRGFKLVIHWSSLEQYHYHQTDNRFQYTSLFVFRIYLANKDNILPPRTKQVSFKSVSSLYRSSSRELPLWVRISTWEGGTKICRWGWVKGMPASDWVFQPISAQRLLPTICK